MAAGDAHHALGVAYGLALESLADEMARPKAFESPREFIKPGKEKKEFNLHVAAPVESGPAGMSKVERKIIVSLAQLERPASIVTVGIVGEFSHRSAPVQHGRHSARQAQAPRFRRRLEELAPCHRSGPRGHWSLPRAAPRASIAPILER
jgi:hypothetical protein